MVSTELLEIVGPAFVAGLIIAITHVPLGLEVFRRGIIFIDLAIAQVAGLGVVVASLYFHEPAWWVVQLAALSFALLAALLFHWVEKKIPQQQEAIIGSSFVVVASLSLMLLSNDPHGGEEIQHLLSGQILFVTWNHVLIQLPIYSMGLVLWFTWINRVKGSAWFYLLFSIVITSSVQLVGVYVVFASLILPALAATGSSKKLLLAWICSAVAVILGIVTSTTWDFPAGPLIVLSYAIVTLSFRAFMPLSSRYMLKRGSN